jgi:hypothetical protein
MDRVLDCQFSRRFGVEIEINTPSGIIVKLDPHEGENPEGADRIAYLISRTLKKPAQIQAWRQTTHNNTLWVVKPDGSCGIEICSPVTKGWLGLSEIMRVIQTLERYNAKADGRCSLHVHVNISDLTKKQLATVMAYYIKCEHIIFDSLPGNRKNSRYCQFIGSSDLFDCNFGMDQDDLISRVSESKYYSINTFHFMKGGGFTMDNNRRQTIEFRVAENKACLDPFYVKNWVRFLLHFVEMTKHLPYPEPYKSGGNEESGLLWLSPRRMFEILGFDQPMSFGMKQVKAWFFGRIAQNGYPDMDFGLPSTFTNKGRISAHNEFMSLIKNESFDDVMGYLNDDVLFGAKYAK